ncbi:MAG: dihydroorotate oxidase [Denitrovibrio sp.]|nr:MAG: dihydroorotate oxidase [Denitrovibrio sp.]
MPDLRTSYMGLQLKNPIIIGSSTLTDTPEKIKALEDNGAAAVVLKSLFEEEVRNVSDSSQCCNYHPEAYYYDMSDAGMLYGISEYLELIKEAKKIVDIPIIASICCENAEWWSTYPKKLEKAGADAIELNLNLLSLDANEDPVQNYLKTIEIIDTVKKNISIPFSVKISPYCCSIPYLVNMFKTNGASGVVMFSRLFRVGINLETIECEPADYYSSPNETYKVLRWINIVSEQLDVELCGNTGIHSSKEVLQHLLAGASAVQMVSSIYKNGPEIIKQTIEEIEQYMFERQFNNLKEMKGFLRSDEKDFDLMYFNSLTHDRFQLADGMELGS